MLGACFYQKAYNREKFLSENPRLCLHGNFQTDFPRKH